MQEDVDAAQTALLDAMMNLRYKADKSVLEAALASMIRDLYDNSIVAYKTAAQQTVSLVLDTIRLAVK